MSDVITVTGNISADPIFKIAPSGVPILSFRLATNHRRFDDSSKTWIDGDTNWYKVSVFSKLAENASVSLKKGERVIVRGRLKVDEWEVEGRKGTSVEISADAVGHDLLFGTTVLTRAKRPQSGESAGDVSVPPAGQSVADAGWASPATEGHPTVPGWSAPLQSPPTSDSPALAVVGAGAAALPEETPF